MKIEYVDFWVRLNSGKYVVREGIVSILCPAVISQIDSLPNRYQATDFATGCLVSKIAHTSIEEAENEAVKLYAKHTPLSLESLRHSQLGEYSLPQQSPESCKDTHRNPFPLGWSPAI